MDALTITTIAASVVAILTFVVATAKFIVQPIRRILQQSEDFRLDWYGQPARPGRTAELGVMDILKGHKDQLSDIETKLSKHMADGHGGL